MQAPFQQNPQHFDKHGFLPLSSRWWGRVPGWGGRPGTGGAGRAMAPRRWHAGRGPGRATCGPGHGTRDARGVAARTRRRTPPTQRRTAISLNFALAGAEPGDSHVEPRKIAAVRLGRKKRYEGVGGESPAQTLGGNFAKAKFSDPKGSELRAAHGRGCKDAELSVSSSSAAPPREHAEKGAPAMGSAGREPAGGSPHHGSTRRRTHQPPGPPLVAGPGRADDPRGSPALQRPSIDRSADRGAGADRGGAASTAGAPIAAHPRQPGPELAALHRNVTPSRRRRAGGR